MSRRLLVVMGTRPEAIKLAPVVHAARAHGAFDVRVVVTAQHRELLDTMCTELDVAPDVDLDVMRPAQTLVDTTTRVLQGLDRVVGELAPDWVIVQGDTTTTFTAALAAFYRRVRVAHVEAGLRTYDRAQPFPEEINRCLTTQLAEIHFAPTDVARDNLLREAVPANRVHVTGNTAIDALLATRARLSQGPSAAAREILLTIHRRENHGEPLRAVLRAVRAIVERHPDVVVRWPVHPNPEVREAARALEGVPRIETLPPLGYRAFVAAMSRATLLLTDSGGIQEEAPALRKPVLVLRNTTERPEAVAAGVAKLVGTNEGTIVDEVSRLLGSAAAYAAMANGASPYGDGRAALRIVDMLATA